MIIKAGNAQGINVDVENYEFSNFSALSKDSDKLSSYTFKKINKDFIDKPELKKTVIKQERSFAEDNSFQIEPVVFLHRGMKQQAHDEKEKRIEEEVKLRLKSVEEIAYKKGLELGQKKAREDIIHLLTQEVNSKLNVFNGFIDSVLKNEKNIIETQKENIYQLIQSLTRWIILRELKEDGEYVNRLLEKLILELDARENLLIKVNKDNFEQMPVVLDLLQKRVGEIKNVRLEINHDDENPGIIVESTNSIIDGSFEEQMKNLDKLFNAVNKHE